MNISSLRISVTKRCNISCPYCHREGLSDAAEDMDLATIRDIAACAVDLGITRFKITGGEPLMRDDIVDIVRTFTGLGATEVSMTTNGMLLAEKAQALHAAGLSRVNIGCDSMSSHVLKKNAESVAAGIAAAHENGMLPIKLNMVVLKDINHTDIEPMIDFAKDNGAILQLIELIDMDHEYFAKHHYSLADIEDNLRARARNVRVRPEHRRRQYHLGDVIVETVRPMHKGFCQNCRKLRVTSDGKLKPCLMRQDNHIPFSGKESMIDAIAAKEAYHD